MFSFSSGYECCSCLVLAVSHSPLAQEFAKKGCPIGQRADLWCQMLGITMDDIVSLITLFLHFNLEKYHK
jgi:hypothetical protein